MALKVLGHIENLGVSARNHVTLPVMLSAGKETEMTSLKETDCRAKTQKLCSGAPRGACVLGQMEHCRTLEVATPTALC